MEINKRNDNFFVYFASCLVNEILNKGYNENIWYLSLKSYICILIVVSSNLLINSYFIVYLLPLTIGVTTFLIFIIFIILNHYGFVFTFNSKASIYNSLDSILIYLGILLICGFHFVLDYTSKLFNIFLNKNLFNKLILRKSYKNRKKSYSTGSKINSSKSNRKQFKFEKRNTLPYDEKSRSYLIPKTYNNKIKKINENYRNYYNQKKFNDSKFKDGEIYKNDFYSLNILKNINNKNFDNINNINNNNEIDINNNSNS